MTGPVIHGQELSPGDLLIVTGTAATSKLIEIGAILVGDPAASHVAGYHHTDVHGVPWGLEGRPGGFGWRDIRDYDADPRTVTNAAQPKTPAQRAQVCEWGLKMIGTPYDWMGGIVHDAAEVLLPEPWRTEIWKPDPATGKVPGAVVCSSAWSWIYDQVGLASPAVAKDWETVTPGAWAKFIEQQAWLH